MITGMMVLALTQAAPAEAHGHPRYWHTKHSHYYGHADGGLQVSGNILIPFPNGFIQISVGGHKYHYRGGTFYKKHYSHYTAVPAPVGACIRDLPRGYVKFWVDGVPYYTYNDVYYKQTRHGYEVIEHPYPRYAQGRTDHHHWH